MIRKQIVLRLCARRIAKLLALDLGANDVQDAIDDFRFRRGLTSGEEMGSWLQAENITSEAFVRAMIDCALVNKIEQEWEADIAQELPVQMGLSLARQERGVNEEISSGWLQFNIALARQHGNALPSARRLFEVLSPVLANWRRLGLLDQFFFVRKPPDLRLRFLVHMQQPSLLSELEELFSRLVREGFVKHFFRSVYEPEVRQFGGPEAMAWVHRYFDDDSMAWIALDRLILDGSRISSPDQLVLAVMNDLFLRTLSCPFEVWDTWCNLLTLMPAVEPRDPPTDEHILLDSLLASVSEAEAKILVNYRGSNNQLATGLRDVWNQGQLKYGLRAVLPFIAMFHFNRHGLDPSRQTAIARAMSHAWDPKRRLRGAD